MAECTYCGNHWFGQNLHVCKAGWDAKDARIAELEGENAVLREAVAPAPEPAPEPESAPAPQRRRSH